MQDLFKIYHTLLIRSRLKWLIESYPKVAVQHLQSASKPWTPHYQLTSDVFPYLDIQKDFNDFLEHTIKFDEPIQIVDADPLSCDRGYNDGSTNQNEDGKELLYAAQASAVDVTA